MLVHVHIKLTNKDLEQLRTRIGFVPDRNTVRAWARSLILDTLQPPGERRPVVSDNGASPRMLLDVAR